jgi:hypothetical protein
MKKFNELGVVSTLKSLTGDKIKIARVLNKEIIVSDFRIEQSKYDGECLYLQIELEKDKRVVFTGSKGLIEAIKQIRATDFPFSTTIVENNDRYEFS